MSKAATGHIFCGGVHDNFKHVIKAMHGTCLLPSCSG